MEGINISEEDFPQLYKLHTVLDSDNDSTISESSNAFYNAHKSRMHSYEQPLSNEVVENRLLENVWEARAKQLNTEHVAGSLANSESNIFIEKEKSRKDELIEAQKPELAKSQEKVDLTYCKMCGTYFLGSGEGHFTSDEHKKKAEAFCDVCCIRTMSKEQLWSHMKGGKHLNKLKELGYPSIQDQYGPFDLTLPLAVKNMMLIDSCQICHVKLTSLSVAMEHYKSPRHERFVRHWFKDMKVVEKQTIKTEGVSSDKSPFCEICQITIDNKESAENHYCELSHFEDLPFYCFVCKIQFDSETDLKNHKVSFPHVQVAELKSSLVSKGIFTAEFWSSYSKLFCCKICGTKIQSPADAVSHFKGTKHSKLFNDWLQAIETHQENSDSSVMWYYCKICDKALDCTTNSRLHYQTEKHLRKSHFFCKTCQISNSSKEMLDGHNMSDLHREKLGGFSSVKDLSNVHQMHTNGCISRDKSLPSNNQQITTQLPNTGHNVAKTVRDIDTDLKSTTNNENAPLQKKVFTELEKLVQTIYYSKKIPLDVALTVLKKFNREVEDLKSNYVLKNAPEKSVASPNDHPGVLLQKLEDFPQNNNVADEKTSSNVNVDGLSVERDPQAEIELLLGMKKKKKNKKNKKVISDTSGAESNKETSSNIADNNVDGDENWRSWLEGFRLIKAEVDSKFANEENIEKDVLNELEQLIDSLYKNDDLPLKEVLACLQEFNERIEPLAEFYGRDLTDDGKNGKHVYGYPDLMLLRSEKTYLEIDEEVNKKITENKIFRKLDLPSELP